MAQRFELLDLWIALGGDPLVFETWMAEPRRTIEDAWAQLVAAVAGDLVALMADTNPPAGELLALVNADPRGGEAGRSRSDGSQPSNHVEGTGIATRRHPDHLCTVEEARSWANMCGSDTKFGRMALTVIALADEIEELHRGQQLRDELTEALCITPADGVDAQPERDRLRDARDWLHDEMYPDDPLARGVLLAVLEQRPWENTSD